MTLNFFRLDAPHLVINQGAANKTFSFPVSFKGEDIE